MAQTAEIERTPANEPVPFTLRKKLDPSEADASPDSADVAPPKRSRKKLIFGGILLLALAAGGYYGQEWWRVGRFMISTDDAYVAADTSVLAAKVSGYIVGVDIADNQPVRKGDVIARIDDVDYKLAVKAAEGKIATQQATLDRYTQQIAAAQASLVQAKAQVVADQAELDRAQADFQRQQELAKDSFASRATLDTARATRDKAKAAVDAAQAAVTAADVNVSVVGAQRTEAERTLDELKIARDQAQRNLDFTAIRAPFDGVVGNRAVEVGQLVQAGTRIAAVVPLSAVYVDANFKETQLGRLRPGQRVRIEVDAYPNEDFEGSVASVSPASGSVFSLLPPENATGNFTKIVQRVPVRVEIDEAARAKGELRPGMSVTAIVDTRGHS
ncbi:HlyD family secretion protein [Ancylobacter sp. 6x-1]|uniref:HlyD family secretion protein n=1 Tax=Ancylobacter crimeensis TaxID=2579147 RepID=A0ABT0DAL3_9HYPH|nr:HlyD family secretion protein [Ancylobacter crimeensis]MCK0196832.1 HlyD family secretion protein [Ancylobacter crimeensis]